MGVVRNIYKILIGKSEGKKPFGRRSRRWEDNIRIDIRECYGWTRLAQERDHWRAVVNTVINLRVI
jgi:hypothetical protein